MLLFWGWKIISMLIPIGLDKGFVLMMHGRMKFGFENLVVLKFELYWINGLLNYEYVSSSNSEKNWMLNIHVWDDYMRSRVLCSWICTYMLCMLFWTRLDGVYMYTRLYEPKVLYEIKWMDEEHKRRSCDLREPKWVLISK